MSEAIDSLSAASIDQSVLPVPKGKVGSKRDTPDQVFDRMLSTSFRSEEKLARFLNGKDKVELIRRYTDLLDRLSYWKLKQAQWDYYMQIGQTQNIWTNRVPKLLVEKNSMVHANGRPKSMIGQCRIQIEQKLEHVQNAIAQFEQQTLPQSVPNVDYSSELHSLSSIVRTFVQENQQQLRSELEYKRKMLFLDATDHRLVQAFFDLNPKKGQIHSARRIWRTTAKQIMVEEEVACLERRLTARPLQPSSTSLDRMIDDIEAMEQTSPTEWERMKQLKKDIIHRCIMTGRGTADSYHTDVLHEQERYFVKRGVDESTAE